jgi:hypothetical protein
VTPERSAGCYLIGRRRGDRLTLLSGSSSSLLVDEGRAVLVFGEPSAAEAFRITEGLGPEWDVIGHHPAEAIEALEISAANGIWYVELDPPSNLTRGHDAPRLVPLRGFLDDLLGE